MADINAPSASVGVNPQNIADSPAYKFRLDQGIQALNRSAAARGNLLTGGTLKDALSFGQGLASTEYGNEWQRQFGLAGLNADISQGNAGRNLSGLLGLYGGGQFGAAGQAGAYGNYGAAGASGSYGAASGNNYAAGQFGNSIGEMLANGGGTLGSWLRNRRTPAALPINGPLPGLVPSQPVDIGMGSTTGGY